MQRQFPCVGPPDAVFAVLWALANTETVRQTSGVHSCHCHRKIVARARTIERLAPYRVSLWGNVRTLNEPDHCSSHNLSKQHFVSPSKSQSRSHAPRSQFAECSGAVQGKTPIRPAQG